MEKEQQTPTKEKVRQLLEEFPETRNSDMILFSYYWYMIDGVDMDGTADNFTETFKQATPPSTIQRYRQMLQYEDENLKKYLPTDPNVLAFRKKKEFATKQNRGII